MATLPTNRTTSSTVTEHLNDHNTIHSLWNIATTKGDLISVTGPQTYIRVPVGTDGQALIADSTQASGLRWGTSGIPPTIVDAKGDLIVATANDTVTRLPVGTDGFALIADSTQATGLRWGPAASDIEPVVWMGGV